MRIRVGNWDCTQMYLYLFWSFGPSETLLDVRGQFVVEVNLVKRKILDPKRFIPFAIEPIFGFRFREKSFFCKGFPN